MALPLRHLGLHRAPRTAVARRPQVWHGESVLVFECTPQEQSLEFELTFDAFLDAVTNLGNAYVEGDGSFVWRPVLRPDGTFFEGNAFDGEQALRYVELKGRGTRADFARLLTTLGWPQIEIMVQVVEDGMMLPVETVMQRWFPETL